MIECSKCGQVFGINTMFPEELPVHECVPHPGDPVDHPDHYCKGGFECIEVIKALNLGYLSGCAFKYLWRYQFKGTPVQDLKKCKVYIDHLIDKLEKQPREQDEMPMS